MENEEVFPTSYVKRLEDRIYKLERDLLDALTKISHLEVEVASLQKVEIASIRCHLETTEDKIDTIGQALRDLIIDLIRQENGRETQHKVKIIRRQNLVSLGRKEEVNEPKSE